MDRANLALAHYLARSGHQVHLVGHRAAADLIGLPNVRFHRAWKPANAYLLGSPILDRVGRHWAAHIAAQGGRIVVNGGNCCWGDVNWVHYVHAAYQPQVAGNALRRWKSQWQHRLFVREERAALRRARVVIVNSERTKRDVVERIGIPAARVRRVYLGIDRDVFRPVSAAERSSAKERLGWSGRPTVAFIGALGDRRKGFDTVFTAWEQLVQSDKWDVDLAVIGAGAELPAWKAHAETAGMEKKIRFLGFRKDVPAVLAACDGLIAPTRYEPYGIAVLEALCMALPVLVSRTAGVAERYPAELSDLLIEDPEDPDALVARLRTWRARKDYFDAMTLRLSGQLRAHTWNDMAAEMAGVMGYPLTQSACPGPLAPSGEVIL